MEIIAVLFISMSGKNTLPPRAKVQYNFKAFSNKGVSSRKLADLGIKAFLTEGSIENISQSSYKKIAPYLLGTNGGSQNKFTVITSHKGLPVDLVRSLGLRVSEILEKVKDLNLTIIEAEKSKKQNWIDSIVQRNQKTKTPNSSFFSQ